MREEGILTMMKSQPTMTGNLAAVSIAKYTQTKFKFTNVAMLYSLQYTQRLFLVFLHHNMYLHCIVFLIFFSFRAKNGLKIMYFGAQNNPVRKIQSICHQFQWNVRLSHFNFKTKFPNSHV